MPLNKETKPNQNHLYVCEGLRAYQHLKNKYQIRFYATSNMDDFKTICMYENLSIFAYFFKRREDFSRLLKKIQHFQISFHVPNTYLILLN